MAIELVSLPEDVKDEAEQVELFSLDGQMYSIPAKPKVNIALKYLRLVRQQGQEVAAGWLLEELLGTEAYEALMDFEDLTEEQLETVMMVAQTAILGAMEGVAAPLGRTSKRSSRPKKPVRA